MKKTLLTLIAFILGLTAFSQIPNYVPQNGLVGWWPFNGNANDESGNGNNGTVNGATLTADRFGNWNCAYNFDLNQKIGCVIPNFSTYSISIWVNINAWNLGIGSGNGGTFVSHKSDALYGNGWALEHNQDQWCWLEYNTSNNSIQYYSGAPSLNNWFHVLFTSNNQGLRQLYINGLISDSYSGGSIIVGGNSYEFKIGAHIDGPTIWWFKGDLDDVGYWNRALTECEIQDLYHAQLGSQSISAGADQSICAGDNVTLSGAGGNNYQWNNNVVDGQAFAPTQSNAYVLTAQDSLGCTGIDTVVVTVLENATSTLTETALDSYTLNGQTYTQSGTYTQTLTAANGCDSTITLNLTLNFTGIDELGTNAKKLVNITDLNGKTIPRRKNTLMLFIYEDGTVERVVEMEE
jgi:hypothetical protein